MFSPHGKQEENNEFNLDEGRRTRGEKHYLNRKSSVQMKKTREDEKND